MSPGQNPGQPKAAAFSWGDLLEQLIQERGSLAAVALHLAQRRGFLEDVESVERGLRRLRHRGNKDGGVWGQRLLRCFGLPKEVSDRLRWMGQYHSRFKDLPTSLAEELLRGWDRPPISESQARIWSLLALLSLVLRGRRWQERKPLLEQLQLVELQAEPAAQIELYLLRSFIWSRQEPEVAQAELKRAGLLLEEPGVELEADDRACLFARWIDQRAYPLNRPRQGPADHQGAEALYEQIPLDGPLFARCRRENGLGWSRLRQGAQLRAEEHARASLRFAGDAGSLRMRAMALNLLAACLKGEAAEEARARALGIAKRLEDEALQLRFRAWVR